MSRAFLSGLLTLVCALHAGPAGGEIPPGYVLTELETFGGKNSYAKDINNLGQAAGSAKTSDGTSRPCVWENGLIRDLGTLPGGTGGWANAINDEGAATGASRTTAAWSPYNAVIWSDGGITDLGQAGTDASGLDINDSGIVVGGDSMGWGAVYWDSQGIHYLAELHGGGGGNTASSINNSGVIAGYSGSTAVIWESGIPRDLGLGYSFAEGINELGQVCGTYDPPEGSRGFLWDPVAGVTNLGTLHGWSQARALNDQAQVVGYFWSDQGSGESRRRAFIWEDGVMYDLNDLIPSDAELVLHEAWGINNLGQIVGDASNSLRHRRGFLLTPIPEPAALALLAVGLAATIVRRPRA